MTSAWEWIAENRISEAIDRGDFDHLPGKGKPLDLSAYFDTPVEDRMAFSILKNAGVLPVEVELLNEAQRLNGQLEVCCDGPERIGLKQQLQAVTSQLALRMEQRTRH